jgi:hypothetical protein
VRLGLPQNIDYLSSKISSQRNHELKYHYGIHFDYVSMIYAILQLIS